MGAFLGASQNIVFVSAIVLMAMIGVVQLIGFGHEFGLDADADLHVDLDGDMDLLGWLGVGRLPLLMLLVVFLASFGMVGLIGQHLSLDLTGTLASPWLAVPAALALSLPLTGLAARGLARVMPRDFTTAVPLDVLIGRRAVIVVGRASAGSPARARAEDQWGQAHYVMVAPNMPSESFGEGEHVLLVRREADLFRAIATGDAHIPTLEGLGA